MIYVYFLIGGIHECGNSPVFDDYFLPIATSRFGVTLCGYPQPQVIYRYLGKEYSALGEALNTSDHMYTNRIELKVNNPSQCGEKVYFEATGGIKEWRKETTIFVRC